MAEIQKINGISYVLEFFNDQSLQGWAVEESLFSGQSPFQKVDVVKTKYMGNMLLNDGLVMTTDRDEFAYHEMMAHVPLFVHPAPERVLIIGGGDGGTAREVLKHKEVQECVMVEIDGMVVEAAKAHLPSTSKDLGNSRLSLLIEDGVRYICETEESFDVVLVDSTDPIGPGAPLFGSEFYKNVKMKLRPGGVVISQGECAWTSPEAQGSLLKILKEEFKILGLYNYTNITYPGGTWSFSWASDSLHPQNDFDPQRVKESGIKFRYYNAGIHSASFQLPQFYYDLYGDSLSIKDSE